MEIDIFKLVEENYKDNFENLEDKRFHFATRLFLWNGDEFSKKKLQQLKAEYIGENEQQYSQKISDILEDDSKRKHVLFKDERERFFEKYPLLQKYNKVLFRNLFCETIYGIDLRNIIQEKISIEDFLVLRSELFNDKEAVAILSTHAVNYFYALAYFLKETSNIGPEYFLSVVEDDDIFAKDSVGLEVYLLTHCIIGESAFYSKHIEKNISISKVISKLEKVLAEDYEKISLDSKVEFLVCCRMCEIKTPLEQDIFLDLLKSFDVERKIFVENKKNKIKDAFRKGEHRNVLAIMAFSKSK